MRIRVPSALVEGLLYALAAFGVFAFGGVEPWSRAAIEVLAFLLALAVFLKGRPAASPAGSWFWLFPAAVAAFGGLQLATAVAPGDPNPLRPFTATPDETRAAVILWAAYAAVLWSVPRVIVTHESARRCARFFFGLGLALAAFGLLQLAVGADKLPWLREGPRFASYYNRDHAANIMLMSLAVGIGLFVSRPHRLMAGGLLVVFLGVAATSSQAAILAIPLAAAVVAFFGADFAPSARLRRLRAGAAVAGAALTVFFAYHHVVASADAGSLIDPNVMGRLFIYGDSWRWWRDAPLFGTGLGGFETLYPSYQDLGLLGTAAHAHSDWIEFALEAGLLGLIGALAAAGLAAFVVARSWREARSSEMRALIGGGLAAAAAFVAHALFEFAFQMPANAVMFFVIVGFLLSAPSWADKSGGRPAEKPPTGGAALLAAAYCFVLMRAAALPAAAEWLADRPGKPLERVVDLARAASLDGNPRFAALLSVASYKAAGTEPDYALMRLSLRYALAAVERRPFSADILYLAGETLRRLGRPADGGTYFDRSATVAFSPIAPRRAPRPDSRRKKLEALKELDFVPRVGEKR